MLDTASPRRDWALRGVWAGGAAGCATAMWLLPGTVTIPFHLIWIGLSLVYGFTLWRPRELAAMAGVTAAVTGAIMVHHAASGRIAWLETAEVPLSVALIAVTAALVRRRHMALVQVAAAAQENTRQAEARQQLMRQIAHELRTPITVARGFTELISDRHPDADTLDDAQTVLDELDKAARITQRLVTLIGLDGPYAIEPVDLPAELNRIVRRWTPTADRDWTAWCPDATVPANRDRLEAVLDCLLDNAVKFTGPGDRISVMGQVSPTAWTVTVADSGPGPQGGPARAGTSLGLVMARAVVEGWGGTIRLDADPDGGAIVAVNVPIGVPASAAVTHTG
jgi:two-component system OmpR family sensor kinase